MTNEVMVSAADRDFEQVGGSTSVVTYNPARTNGYQQGINSSSNEWYFTRYFPKSGTYRVKFVYWKTSDKGIIDIGLDDSTDNIFNGVDQYKSSALWNTQSFSVIKVARGNHKITFKINGKNASSSGYFSDSILLQFDLIDEHDVLGEDAPSEDKPFWEDLGAVYHTGADATSITTGEFPAKKYLKVFVFSAEKPSGNNTYLKCNNSTGSDYSFRGNANGGTDNTTSMQNRAEGFLTNLDPSGSGTVTGLFAVYDIINILDEEKLCICHSASGWTNAGVGVAPARFECVSKWDILTEQITSLQYHGSAGGIVSGSFVRVLGHD